MNKKVTTKKEKSKNNLVKPKVIYKSNLTNVLLIVLICLFLVLIVLISINISLKISDDVSQLIEESNILDENVIDVNFNVSIQDPLENNSIDLNDVSLKESELMNEIVVSLENIDSLKNSYSFVFDESLIDAYGFVSTSIGDVILEYRDYIIIYNVEQEQVKSIWNIEYIDN